MMKRNMDNVSHTYLSIRPISFKLNGMEHTCGEVVIVVEVVHDVGANDFLLNFVESFSSDCSNDAGLGTADIVM